jgi:hypothetical protein
MFLPQTRLLTFTTRNNSQTQSQKYKHIFHYRVSTNETPISLSQSYTQTDRQTGTKEGFHLFVWTVMDRGGYLSAVEFARWTRRQAHV